MRQGYRLMVRFSQNYGARAVEGSLDYFKKESGAKHILYTCAHTIIQVYKRSITVFSYSNFTI